jgi:hypothetical protein
MFERFRRGTNGDRGYPEERGGVATEPRPGERERAHDERTTGAEVRGAETGVSAATAREVRARQRDEYGGISWGAAFFGWLVALGMAAILTAILSAAGAAIGLTEVSGSEASDNAETVGIVGGALLVAVLVVSYYCGGYVSGRMSRFDGARQGFAAWIIGLIVTALLALAGVVLGSEYNVLERLDLPRIPVDEGALTTGGIITLAAIVVGTLLAALLGGKAGERFHRKVDRYGYGL